MELVPAGKFQVKLEFEDDSFELTEAEILPNGKFSCISASVTEKTPFKMVFLADDNDLKEYLCSVETIQNKLIHGKLKNLDM